MSKRTVRNGNKKPNVCQIVANARRRFMAVNMISHEDSERIHKDCDDILLDFIQELGHSDIVDMYINQSVRVKGFRHG